MHLLNWLYMKTLKTLNLIKNYYWTPKAGALPPDSDGEMMAT